GVKGWRRRPAARRRCDRPVGAGRSTALRAVLAPHQPGPGRQIVIKTATPSADSRAKPDPSEADSTPFTNHKVADRHRSPFSPPLPQIGGPDQPPPTYPLPSMCFRSMASSLILEPPRTAGSGVIVRRRAVVSAVGACLTPVSSFRGLPAIDPGGGAGEPVPASVSQPREMVPLRVSWARTIWCAPMWPAPVLRETGGTG